MAIDFTTIIPKFDSILERGLSRGVGQRDGQMCIEAAICAAMDLPHGDEPSCVAPAVRKYKIALNDSSRWVSAESRAAGLRALGIAQIGSAGVVNDHEFSTRLAEKTIRVLIPKLFREVFPNSQKCLEAADRCEREGTKAAAAAAYAARAANAESYLTLSASLALEVLKELKSPGCEWIDWKPSSAA